MDREDSGLAPIGKPAPTGVGDPVAGRGVGTIVPLDFIEKALFAQAFKEARETGVTIDAVLDRWDNTPAGPRPWRLPDLNELIDSIKIYNASYGDDG